MGQYSDLSRSSIEVISVTNESVSISMLFVAELSTGNPNLRPSMFYYFGNQSGAYVIGNYDPRWRLLETNNITIWRWSLSESHTVKWTAGQSLAGLSFPFEILSLDLFLVSNSTSANFSVFSRVPNFDVQSRPKEIGYDELPFKDQSFERFSHYYKIEITAYHNTEYKWLVLILYSSLAFVGVVALVLWRRRGVTPTQDSNQIWLGLLLFLPIFFLTFRSSLAPPWVTNLDISVAALIAIFAILLALQLNRKKAEPARVGRIVESPNTLAVLAPYLIALGMIMVAVSVTVAAAKKRSNWA